METFECKTLTVAEVSAILGVSKSVVYEMCRKKEIPALRLGRRWVIPYTPFMKWLGEPVVERAGAGFVDREEDDDDDW